MIIKKCGKCNSDNLTIIEKGKHHGLYCKDCGSWQKWISNKEIDIYKELFSEKIKLNSMFGICKENI